MLILKVVRGVFFEHFVSVDSKWVSPAVNLSSREAKECPTPALRREEKRRQAPTGSGLDRPHSKWISLNERAAFRLESEFRYARANYFTKIIYQIVDRSVK